MIGKGVSRECFQPQICSGRMRPKTSNVKGNCRNVVYIDIDIDSDQLDDVVIIDYPEFMKQKSHGSSGKRPIESVISIDDDENDNFPGTFAEGGGELDSDASSSKAHFPASTSGCHVNDKSSSSKLPKCEQTCSAKAAQRNRYGLNNESESASSDSDCSDCELMEAREQWEKASVKRKRHAFNGQNTFESHASSSGFRSNTYTNIEVENRTEKDSGSSVCSPSKGKYVRENLSSFSVTGDGKINGTDFNLGTDNPDQRVDQERFKMFRSGSIEELRSLHQNFYSQDGDNTRSKSNNFASGVFVTSSSKKEMGGKDSNCTSSSKEESKRQVDSDGSASRNKDENSSEDRSNYGYFDERRVQYDGFVFQESCDRQINSALRSEGKIGRSPEDSLFCNHRLQGNLRTCNCSKAEVTTDSEVISVPDDSQDQQERSTLVENETPSDIDDTLHAQDDGVAASDIIGEREKLKETDEYKRAIEEEWASRQRQLQIQAEEVQRLRRRKKAEKRLLEMQRRQKERIEEVRETQKKDEENMNMKEQLRVEIRKGLKRLEMTCSDMASLLRGLGIQVGGGLNPLPKEVHAAYKRALLKFHPDRASKTDIREQVEAEEKFKLISRMKDRFLSTSGY
ncbi:hypothetical protein L6164_001881 [Bauhinia variegata]|uniref:Uncharacterized protein n=1 Tax=Bauhinia variegata TaxID=167791 RepID=A0ACB9QCD7_BAUVA|nr:hypothetical protein L6164_001881 [Bauhinia variegata]